MQYPQLAKFNIIVNIATQQLVVLQGKIPTHKYHISSARLGTGNQQNSYKTPLGKHIIRAKIGANCPVNSVFVARRLTGECFNENLYQKYPNRDWILTRILWLSGTEVGYNRLGNVDSMRRYIYIHGTPDQYPLGIPQSQGCIRMHNKDIVELFNLVPINTKVEIFK